MKNHFQVIEKSINYLHGVNSVGIIGDPGCEGLGTYNMKVYAGSLEETAKDDITLVVGDLVPIGTEHYYSMIKGITETIAENDVYVLRGNHDTGEYDNHFGKKNYAIITDNFAIIIIDNAIRKFDAEGLSLVSEVLSKDDVKQAIIAYHIPAPNHFIKNSVSDEEFARLQDAYKDHKDKVAYMVCGHVHSRFEDVVDGIPLICSGGGGAMIEDVSEDIKACDVEHHVVHFFMENGKLIYEIKNISENCYSREQDNPIIKDKLKETVAGELMAHLKYMMFADRAKRRGMDNVANLFSALAASEYYHARNFYSVIEKDKAFSESVETYIPGEEFEYQKLYAMMEDFADESNAPLTKQAYQGASAAERVHAELLKEAEDLEGFDKDKVYVCPICGFVMAGDNVPDRCPVCGGPGRQYRAFEAVI